MKQDDLHRRIADLERMVEALTDAVRAGEERFRSLVETTSDCIWETDPAGCFSYLSPKFRDHTGYAPEACLGRLPSDLSRELGDHPFGGQFPPVLAARQPFASLEFPSRHRGDTQITLELTGRPLLGPDGVFRGMQGSARDISARKRVEEELRKSEDLYRAIVENQLEYVERFLPGGILTYVNSSLARWAGAPKEYLLGMSFYPAIHEDDRADVIRKIESVTPENPIAVTEHRIRKADGTEQWQLWTGLAFFDEAGRVIEYQSVGRDITAQKQLEQDLRNARKAAEAANRAKSEFLANMSHEIRTPLHVITGMAELLGFTPLTEKQVTYLDAIRTSSENLLSLIDDVLDLSKIEADKIELEQRSFSLRESISDIVNTQITLVFRKGLSFQADIPADVPDNLIGDQLRLKQILLNLLGNAIKFTSQGGIRVSVDVLGRRDSGVLLQIGVADTGIGICPAALEKIFEPFVQADASTTRQYGGTGLGLAICTRLVEKMGGSIRAESREGIGSTFLLHLPFTVSEAVAEQNRETGWRTAPPSWNGPPLGILLVDDQEHILTVTRELLQVLGHTVVEARDGREALSIWEREPLDIILMDVQMAVMSGIEATRAIREREQETGGHQPIIAMTARALQEERDQIRSQGFDGYVTKPFEIGTLLDEIQRCLGSA